jgi:hypothetical protein
LGRDDHRGILVEGVCAGSVRIGEDRLVFGSDERGLVLRILHLLMRLMLVLRLQGYGILAIVADKWEGRAAKKVVLAGRGLLVLRVRVMGVGEMGMPGVCGRDVVMIGVNLLGVVMIGRKWMVVVEFAEKRTTRGLEGDRVCLLHGWPKGGLAEMRLRDDAFIAGVVTGEASEGFNVEIGLEVGRGDVGVHLVGGD